MNNISHKPSKKLKKIHGDLFVKHCIYEPIYHNVITEVYVFSADFHLKLFQL